MTPNNQSLTSTPLILLFFLNIGICSTGCLALVNSASIANSTAKTIQGSAIRKNADSMEYDSLSLDENVNYATYYLYRRGAYVGALASCLIYDNNNYIGVSNNSTFQEVDNVIPGRHIFTSKVDAKNSVTVDLEEGRTYILRVMQSYKLREGELFIMDQAMIKKELKKEIYFKEMCEKFGLNIDDISF